VYDASANDAAFLSNLFTTDQLSGNSPAERLKVVLRGTGGIVPGQQFRGDFGSTGFLEEMYDGGNQVGHFLTGVSLAYHLGSDNYTPIAVAIGHEMSSDSPLFSTAKQMFQGLMHPGQVDNFRLAVGADARGDFTARDAYLKLILAAVNKTTGAGNTRMDLVLTVRAFRWAQMIKDGAFADRAAAAEWLRQNIGQ